MESATKIYAVSGAIALLVIGFLVGRNFFPKIDEAIDVNLSIVEKYNDSIAKYKRELDIANTEYFLLEKDYDSINDAHSKIRVGKITNKVKDSLTDALVSKGTKDFGNKGDNPKEETALAYGNNYADMYAIQSKQIKNQKVKEVAYTGIIKSQDTIIQAQLKVIRIASNRKDKAKTKIGWFLAGLATGLAIPL